MRVVDDVRDGEDLGEGDLRRGQHGGEVGALRGEPGTDLRVERFQVGGAQRIAGEARIVARSGRPMARHRRRKIGSDDATSDTHWPSAQAYMFDGAV